MAIELVAFNCYKKGVFAVIPAIDFDTFKAEVNIEMLFTAEKLYQFMTAHADHYTEPSYSRLNTL